MTAPRCEILLAYRQLYQHLLRTVQYATPYRRIVRDKLRKAFRESSADAYDRERVARTLEFLRNAATHTGLEHRIVKNLVHMEWGRFRMLPLPAGKKKDSQRHLIKTAYDQVEGTIEKLNETMGLCLK